jgi:hypothetical protein
MCSLRLAQLVAPRSFECSLLLAIRVEVGRTLRWKAPRVRLNGTILRGIAREAALCTPDLSGVRGESFSSFEEAVTARRAL